MEDAAYSAFIIIGRTTEGEKFRPSDWAERLCGIMSVFDADKHMKYSPYVELGSFEGYKAVFVDSRLGELEPMAYYFLRNFAQDNQLQVMEGVCDIDHTSSAQ